MTAPRRVLWPIVVLWAAVGAWAVLTLGYAVGFISTPKDLNTIIERGKP